MNNRSTVFMITLAASMMGLVFLGSLVTMIPVIQGQIPLFPRIITPPIKPKIISNLTTPTNATSTPTTPTNATALSEATKLNRQGTVLLSAGKYNESLAYLDKALALNPNFVYALIGKGIDLVKLGKYNESLAYLDKALAINPQDVNALNYKKIALNALNKK
jgi:tetratricopeptide (TPR) repeat protein